MRLESTHVRELREKGDLVIVDPGLVDYFLVLLLIVGLSALIASLVSAVMDFRRARRS